MNKFSVLLLSVFLGFTLFSNVNNVFASNWNSTYVASTEAFTIIDDSAGVLEDIYLQFGDLLGETLTFNRSADRFEFSNDLYVNGDIESTGSITGSTLATTSLPNCETLETNTGGQLVCGAGTVIAQTGSSLATIQVRSTIAFNLVNQDQWYQLTFNTVDSESNTDVLEHNTTTTSRVDVKEDGYYFMSYRVDHNSGGNHELWARVTQNGAEIAGSYTEGRNFGGEFSPNVISVVSYLNAGDYVELEAQRKTALFIQNDTILTVTKLEGVRGPAGTGGLLQADADDLYVNVSGDTMTGTLNITNGGELSVEGNITTDANLGLNNDGAAVDVGIRFGGPATQSLVYAIGNTRFEFSDDVYINGNAAVTENLFINVDDTAADASISFGGTTPQNLLYSNTNTRFEFSDDTRVNGRLEVTGNINSPCGAGDSYSFERGGVSSNASWAIGNGQTPWGAPMACSGTVTAMSAVCTGAIGTSLTAVLRKNNVSTTCVVNMATAVGDATSVTCNESFAVDDVLGIYAGTEVGTWTECVGTFWSRYDIQ